MRVMLISASRRTDIPAFYSKWFMNRIQEGYYMKVNPFNRHQTKRISLLKEDVDAICFWTKNPKPMKSYIPELLKMEYRFLFQYTLNNYPEDIEPGMPNLANRIDEFRSLSELIGAEKVIWRYDPIVLSNKTNVEYHMKHFTFIAEQLAGYTNRVMISFQDFYKKTKGRLSKLENEAGYCFEDWLSPDNHTALHSLVTTIEKVCKETGIVSFTCSEMIDLDQYGIKHGACIDKSYIEDVFNLPLSGVKDKYQRAECGCMEAEEMGSYDTCPFGCVYCYAVRSEKLVQTNRQKHDPTSPFLLING